MFKASSNSVVNRDDGMIIGDDGMIISDDGINGDLRHGSGGLLAGSGSSDLHDNSGGLQPFSSRGLHDGSGGLQAFGLHAGLHAHYWFSCARGQETLSPARSIMHDGAGNDRRNQRWYPRGCFA